MDKQHKKRSNNFVNDPRAYNHGESNSFSNVDEDIGELWKRRRTNDHGITGVSPILAEHKSQDTASQTNMDPLQSFVTQPSASQLLLHVVLRYVASHFSQGLQSTVGNGAPSTDASFNKQPTGPFVPFSRNEDRLRSGSFAIEQTHPSLTASPVTSNSGYSSAIQTIINILQQQSSSQQQQMNLSHSQTQQNQWVPATNHAPPWSTHDRVACTSFPSSNTVLNQESIMSMLTQSASRLHGQDQGYDLFSSAIPSRMRYEQSTSALPINGGVPGLTNIGMSSLLQGTHLSSRDDAATRVGARDTSGDSSAGQSRLDIAEILRQLSSQRPSTSDHSFNSSQNVLRNAGEGLTNHIPSSGISATHNADSGRALTELLLRASGQWTSSGNDHVTQHMNTTASQQIVNMSPIRPSAVESQRRKDVDTQPLAGQATVVLAMSCDKDMLSPYQCLVRQQIELFEATQEDVNTNAQGRNRPIVLGQVGIRCRHCTFLALHLRARGCTYYPSTATGLYQASQNLASGHLCDHCKNIPSSVRGELCRLRERKSSAGGGKKYWADGVRSLGVFEDDHGLRFSKEERR